MINVAPNNNNLNSNSDPVNIIQTSQQLLYAVKTQKQIDSFVGIIENIPAELLSQQLPAIVPKKLFG
jgi:hypothetical protein